MHWRLVLSRLWFTLGALVCGLQLWEWLSHLGDRGNDWLHIATWTCLGWFAVWFVVGWIFRPAFSR